MSERIESFLKGQTKHVSEMLDYSLWRKNTRKPWNFAILYRKTLGCWEDNQLPVREGDNNNHNDKPDALWYGAFPGDVPSEEIQAALRGILDLVRKKHWKLKEAESKRNGVRAVSRRFCPVQGHHPVLDGDLLAPSGALVFIMVY